MVSFTRGKGKKTDAEQAMRRSEDELLKLTEEQQRTEYYQSLNASEKALFDSLNTAFQGDLNIYDLTRTNLLQSLTKTLTILPIEITIYNKMSGFKHRDAFALNGIGGANGKRKRYLKTHPVDYVLKDQDSAAPKNERVGPILDDSPEPMAAAGVEPEVSAAEAEEPVEPEISSSKEPVFTGDPEIDAEIKKQDLAELTETAKKHGHVYDETMAKPQDMEASWENLDPNIQRMKVEAAQQALAAKAAEDDLVAGMAKELGIPEGGTLDDAIAADEMVFKEPDDNKIDEADLQAALDDEIAKDSAIATASFMPTPFGAQVGDDIMTANQMKPTSVDVTFGEVDLSAPETAPAQDTLTLLPSMRTDLPKNILTGDPEADAIIENIVRDELFAKGEGTVTDITGEWNSFEPAHQEDLKRFAERMVAQNESNTAPDRLVGQDTYDRIAAHVIAQGTGSHIKRNDIKSLLVQEGYTGDKRKAVGEIIRTMDETGVTRFEGYNKRVVAPTEPFNEAAPHTVASDEIGEQVKIAETGLETARGALSRIVALEAAATSKAQPHAAT